MSFLILYIKSALKYSDMNNIILTVVGFKTIKNITTFASNQPHKVFWILYKHAKNRKPFIGGTYI